MYIVYITQNYNQKRLRKKGLFSLIYETNEKFMLSTVHQVLDSEPEKRSWVGVLLHLCLYETNVCTPAQSKTSSREVASKMKIYRPVTYPVIQLQSY